MEFQQVLVQFKDLSVIRKAWPELKLGRDWTWDNQNYLRVVKSNYQVAECKNIFLSLLMLFFFSIGSRDMHYVYKQKFKPEDARDSVILNKLRLEYENLKALTNGDEKALLSHNLAS